MGNNKITVFFDVDGVLNTKSQWTRSYQLNENCIREFCHFVNDIRASVVIASSWRTGFLRADSDRNYPHIKDLETRLVKYRVKIVGKTPIVGPGKRDLEIQQYSEQHPSDMYIVIDDDPQEYTNIDKHIYFVSASTGFTKKDAKEIKKKWKKLV